MRFRFPAQAPIPDYFQLTSLALTADLILVPEISSTLSRNASIIDAIHVPHLKSIPSTSNTSTFVPLLTPHGTPKGATSWTLTQTLPPKQIPWQHSVDNCARTRKREKGRATASKGREWQVSQHQRFFRSCVAMWERLWYPKLFERNGIIASDCKSKTKSSPSRQWKFLAEEDQCSSLGM